MRYSSIDLLRTLAIFVMVFVHFCENLAGYSPKFAGLGAPLFMFLSGISFRLWLNGQLTRGIADTTISKITVRRGLFLFGVGFAFNILVWLPEDVFNWDVLTLIGSGIIALNFARRAPVMITLLFCAMVILISPSARAVADWPAFWTQGYFDPDLTLTDVIQGYLVVGYFPVLPWIVVPLLGFVTATLVFGTAREQLPNQRVLLTGFLIGMAMVVLAAAAIATRYFSPQLFPTTWPKAWTMFPPSCEYLLATIGFALSSFCGSYRWLDQSASPTRFSGLKKLGATFSRHSFTAYILHHLAHLWPLWIYAIATGHEPTQFWRKATTVPIAVLLATVFLVCCWLLFRWMDRFRVPGVESWMRWVCD